MLLWDQVKQTTIKIVSSEAFSPFLKSNFSSLSTLGTLVHLNHSGGY